MRHDPSSFVVPVGFWERDQVQRALRTRDAGALLRLVRKYTGASLTGLMMRTQIAKSELSNIVNDKSTVRALERFEALADGLGMPDDARIRLGLAPSPRERREQVTSADSTDIGMDLGATVTSAVAAAAALWRVDMHRRSLLTGAVYAAAGSLPPAMQWLVGPAAASVTQDGRRAVGTAQVQAWREIIGSFRALDNKFGGGHARASLVSYLHHEVAPALSEGRYGEATGQQLFGTAAEMTHLAGWMAYDSEDHALAQRYLIQALSLAKVAGDKALSAEILAALSHQAIYLDNAAEGLALARAAGHAATASGLPALVAETAVTEAHAHAKLGDTIRTAHALRAAERAMATTTPDHPDWLTYFDDAYLAAKFAHCFTETGDNKLAEEFAQRSLDMNPDYVRGRSFNVSVLSVAQANQGKIELACHTANEAIDLSAAIRSQRSLHYVNDISRALADHADTRQVRDFEQRRKDLLLAA